MGKTQVCEVCGVMMQVFSAGKGEYYEKAENPRFYASSYGVCRALYSLEDLLLL